MSGRPTAIFVFLSTNDPRDRTTDYLFNSDTFDHCMQQAQLTCLMTDYVMTMADLRQSKKNLWAGWNGLETLAISVSGEAARICLRLLAMAPNLIELRLTITDNCTKLLLDSLQDLKSLEHLVLQFRHNHTFERVEILSLPNLEQFKVFQLVRMDEKKGDRNWRDLAVKDFTKADFLQIVRGCHSMRHLELPWQSSYWSLDDGKDVLQVIGSSCPDLTEFYIPGWIIRQSLIELPGSLFSKLRAKVAVRCFEPTNVKSKKYTKR
jgi:hypothetical protein